MAVKKAHSHTFEQ